MGFRSIVKKIVREQTLKENTGGTDYLTFLKSVKNKTCRRPDFYQYFLPLATFKNQYRILRQALNFVVHENESWFCSPALQRKLNLSMDVKKLCAGTKPLFRKEMPVTGDGFGIHSHQPEAQRTSKDQHQLISQKPKTFSSLVIQEILFCRTTFSIG